MTDLPTDPIHQKIVRGLVYASASAARRAQETGTMMVVWRNNQVVEITPEEFLKGLPTPLPEPEFK